jgi:hypothetical protein
MNDLSGVGIAALLLALLPLVQRCFRMVRLRCSPANGARGDQQRRDAVLTAIAAPSAKLSRFQPDLRTSSDKRRVLTFGRIFCQLGPVHTPEDRGSGPSPAAIAAQKEDPE